MFLWKAVPIEILSLKNAFMALSRKSFKPLLVSPDGVQFRAWYYWKWDFSWMILPVLLKIIHFGFSIFTINSLSLQYFSIDFNSWFSPSSSSDRSTMSSVHIRQLGCSDFGFVEFRSASNILERIDMYVTSRGLSIQACFTP